MQLSVNAKKDLRKVLENEIGKEQADDFSDEELNKLGELLLNIFAEHLKMKVASPEMFTYRV